MPSFPVCRNQYPGTSPSPLAFMSVNPFGF
jgi:hypothetical protein